MKDPRGFENDVSTDTLDILLAGLSGARPSLDFEERILKTLEARRLNPVPQRSEGATPRAALRATALVLGALAALLALLMFTPKKSVQPFSQPTLALGTPNPIPTVPVPSPPPIRHRRSRHSPPAIHLVVPVAQINYPAPQMPLTSQEKLLLQLTRTLTPDQLAGLNRYQKGPLTDQSQFQFDRSFPAPMPPPAWPALPETLPAPPATTPIF